MRPPRFLLSLSRPLRGRVSPDVAIPASSLGWSGNAVLPAVDHGRVTRTVLPAGSNENIVARRARPVVGFFRREIPDLGSYPSWGNGEHEAYGVRLPTWEHGHLRTLGTPGQTRRADCLAPPRIDCYACAGESRRSHADAARRRVVPGRHAGEPSPVQARDETRSRHGTGQTKR
jgi:hypothetical protein